MRGVGYFANLHGATDAGIGQPGLRKWVAVRVLLIGRQRDDCQTHREVGTESHGSEADSRVAFLSGESARLFLLPDPLQLKRTKQTGRGVGKDGLERTTGPLGENLSVLEGKNEKATVFEDNRGICRNRRNTMRSIAIKLLVIAAVILAATSAFASYSYDFDVNTTSLNGQSGYIDLQFNPGISSTDPANAAITGFSSDATLGVAVLTGGATGALPYVTIFNSDQFNDYFQALTFGNAIHFALNLSEAAGNSFALSFYASDEITPLLTSDPYGFATLIDIYETGAVIAYRSNEVSVTGNAVPLPASFLLFGSGLAGLAGLRIRKRA